MAIRKFEIKQTFEEIEIAGKTYRINFDDESIKRYQHDFVMLKKDYQSLMSIDEKSFSTEEEMLKHFEDIKSAAKIAIESILGTDKFDQIYEDCGRSITNIYDLIWFLKDIVVEKQERNADVDRSKYIKSKKK